MSVNKEIIGNIVESQQIQILIIVLIILDTLVAFTTTLLSYDRSMIILFDINGNTVVMLRSLTTFLMAVFWLEIFCVILTFRLKILTHIGYITDIMVCLFQLYFNHKFGSYLKLLNFLRLWRLLRFAWTMLDFERDSLRAVETQLAASARQVAKLEDEIRLVKETLLKETATRASLESALLRYQEEVETLNEALTIAAQDIAEVAEAQEEEEEELEDEEDEEGGVGGDDQMADATYGDGDGGEEEDGFKDALSSLSDQHRIGSASRREQLYQESTRDQRNERQKGLASLGKRKTLRIRDDGSFEALG